MKETLWTCVLVLVVQAADASDTQRTWEVKFDYGNTRTQGEQLNADDGDRIEVKIENATLDCFDYTTKAVVAARDFEIAVEVKAAGASSSFEIVHKTPVQRYEVAIAKKTTPNSCSFSGVPDRRIFNIWIAKRWHWDFSGGFASVVDPQEPRYYRDGENRVQMDDGKRDKASLGLATFYHLHRRDRERLALSVGLTLREDLTLNEYMLGVGFRFGDAATFSVGVALVPLPRLPSGVHLGDEVGESVLKTLPERNAVRPFFAVSFSFANRGDDVRGRFGPAAR